MAAWGTKIAKHAELIRIYHECEDGIKKICPKDHRLISRCMPGDDKRCSRETDFSIAYLHQ